MSRRFDNRNAFDPGRRLSPHFSLFEFTKSQVANKHGLVNLPREECEIANMSALCAQVLEPARAMLKAPLTITSGYRCPTLNRLVGGSAKSQHMLGEAADIVPVGCDVEDAAMLLATQDEIPFDQLIYEIRERMGKAPARWIHISLRRFGENRRECLTIYSSTGKRVAEAGIKPLSNFIT